MSPFVVLLVGIGATWLLLYNLVYSPQAQVRRLLKQMFNIPIKLARAKRKMGDENHYFYNTCKEALDVRYRAVVALLDLYFDAVEDKEYILEKTNYARAMLNNVDKVMADQK